MKNKPLDFQKATAEHVVQAFKNNQRRVLVADEAGLGKTTVASGVIKQVKELDGIFDDNIYCIVYVCCNLQIAQQNIDTLTDDGEMVDLAQSRLSMQHYVYYRKKTDLLSRGKDTLVLSLTPATSFQMSWGTGSVYERALIYACLLLLPYFEDSSHQKRLYQIFQGNAYQSWKRVSDLYRQYVNADDMEEYRENIVPKISEYLNGPYVEGRTILDEINRLTSGDDVEDMADAEFWLIVTLRKMFAAISLEVLPPDLVIMDEFQKFSSLICTEKDATKDSEENMVARKFFANKDTYILLLSATPYKPYTTIEELNETNNDEQYKDFHRLLDFLYENQSDIPEIKVIWQSYSSALSHLGKIDFEELLKKHDKAEGMLYRVMGRTERHNTGIIKELTPDLSNYLSEGDVSSYIQMQHLIDNCRVKGQRVFSAPVDYTKSTAFQLSFMDNYKLKDSIQTGWKAGAGRKSVSDCLLLDRTSIEYYKLSRYNNARLHYVIEQIFGSKQQPTHAEQLLWVPTSHPYYQTGENVFTRNKAFSKYLVFSSWGMVPKMLASLISYEAERRLYKRAYKGATYSNDAKVMLRDDKRSQGAAVLNTVSIYLANLYQPENTFGKKLSEIKAGIKTIINQRLAAMPGERTNRLSSIDTLLLMRALDSGTNTEGKIYSNAADVLADISIASPASCLYRSLLRNREQEHNIDEVKATAENVAKELVGLFNNRYGIAAVRLTCKSPKEYFLRVLGYCALGNLQATLDEFIHMIGEGKSLEHIEERMKDSLISAFRQPVGTRQGFSRDEKLSMRKHFAVDFGNSKQTEEAVEHAGNVRVAFNSPFRPFVLASTSIGQEGLDFHWYCRKMIHWNLPSNPQNLEQREGRINRYKCLSVRRNVAKAFGNYFTWSDMFTAASSVLQQKNSEMVPFWFLPLDNEIFEGTQVEYIERIIPIYPMSEERGRYEHLIDVLSLYRLTMGQPRQEELLQLLKGKIDKEQIHKLLFNLSPYSRNTKKG